MKRRAATALAAVVGMLLLIIDTGTAAAGAREGLSLCLQTVIPSLFPFFVISALLTNAMTGCSFAAIRPIGQLCGIPAGSEILLITGLLGGYPVGAQAVNQAFQNGQLTKKDARRMLGFCSNAGPAFFFGILPMQFENRLIPLYLWLIHILSCVTVGAILPGKSKEKVCLQKSELIGISGAVSRSVTITAGVCAWIVLFRILIALLSSNLLTILPSGAVAVISGLLELANGCCQLSAISDTAVRFVIASFMLAFGGLCVTMQTVTATGGLGLGLYLQGKLLQAIISTLLSALVCLLLFQNFIITRLAIPLLFLLIISVVFLKKKSVAFPRRMVYN